MAKKRKKLIETQTWTIVIKQYDDGSSSMTRTNDGFNAVELMGLSELVSHDVREQIAGRIKPDKIKRRVMVD